MDGEVPVQQASKMVLWAVTAFMDALKDDSLLRDAVRLVPIRQEKDTEYALRKYRDAVIARAIGKPARAASRPGEADGAG